MAWKKIGEGLYQDTVTGAMGVLKKNKGGGLFVASSENYKGTYKKEFGNYEYEKINKKHKAYKANHEIENAIREKDNAFDERQRMKRKYGELSEEFKKADDKYKEALDKRDYWYDKSRRLETEDLKYSMNVSMATEKGIDIKQSQLENLKTAGNVTQNTTNLENAYIEQKNIRAKLNKTGMDKASKSLINKDLSAEFELSDAKERYSKMYGKEATKDIISRGQEALDRKSLSKDGLKNKISQDEILNPREAVNYYLKKGEFSKADKYMKDYGLEDERDAFLDGQNYKVQADYKLYERKYNNLNEAIADRDSKLNRYINSKTPLEKMNRQQLAEYIVDDQISRGIVKEESRAMQVQGRLKGMGASKSMSKKELYLGAKDTQLAKMSLSELRKTAQEYNIDTTGLSRQKLMAKLIAIFK